MSPRQCLAARALIGLSRSDLSHRSGVSRNTIETFESGRRCASKATITKLRAAFVSLSVRFTEDSDGIGVRCNFTLDEIETRVEFNDRPVAAQPIETGSGHETSFPLTPQQARAARAFLDISQSQAAKEAKVSLALVVTLEAGDKLPRIGNAQKIRQMYEAHGIAFTEINGVPAIQFASASQGRR